MGKYKDPDYMKKYSKKYFQEHKEEAYAQNKKWREENPEKNRESKRKWDRNNQDKKKEWIESNPDKVKTMKKKYRESNREELRIKGKEYNLRTKYNMTVEQYDNMRANQENRCKICYSVLVFGKAHVDHCHKTGKVRGILCSRCNLMIGQAKEDVTVLHNAIKYLEETK